MPEAEKQVMKENAAAERQDAGRGREQEPTRGFAAANGGLGGRGGSAGSDSSASSGWRFSGAANGATGYESPGGGGWRPGIGGGGVANGYESPSGGDGGGAVNGVAHPAGGGAAGAAGHQGCTGSPVNIANRWNSLAAGKLADSDKFHDLRCGAAPRVFALMASGNAMGVLQQNEVHQLVS